MSQPLQQFLSRALGISRRKADSLIVSGVVHRNEAVALPGSRYERGDIITVSGQLVLERDTHRTYAVYKPRGVVSSTAAQGTSSVVTSLHADFKGLHLAGRLDKDSEGLIILTSDGDLTYTLTHPSQMHQKHYEVHVSALQASRPLETALREGIDIDGRLLKASNVIFKPTSENRAAVCLSISEGRYHIIRRALGACGWSVVRLIRTGIGSYMLPNRNPGWHALLTDVEIGKLVS